MNNGYILCKESLVDVDGLTMIQYTRYSSNCKISSRDNTMYIHAYMLVYH